MCGWLREVSQVYRIVLSFVNFVSPRFCFTNRLTHPIMSARRQCFPSKLVISRQSTQKKKNHPDCWSRLGQAAFLSQSVPEQVMSADGRKIQLIHLTRAVTHKILWSDKTKIELSCVYSVMQRKPGSSTHQFNTIPGFTVEAASCCGDGWDIVKVEG